MSADRQVRRQCAGTALYRSQGSELMGFISFAQWLKIWDVGFKAYTRAGGPRSETAGKDVQQKPTAAGPARV